MKQLKCEICKEIIAVFDPDQVTVPIRGSMFKSKDPVHGLPDPFPGDPDWPWIKCPYCRNQPYIIDHEKEPRGPRRLLTTEGFLMLEDQEVSEEEAGKMVETLAEEAVSAGIPMSDAVVLDITKPVGEDISPLQREKHICDICGREFSKRMALVGHMKAHRGEKK